MTFSGKQLGTVRNVELRQFGRQRLGKAYRYHRVRGTVQDQGWRKTLCGEVFERCNQAAGDVDNGSDTGVLGQVRVRREAGGEGETKKPAERDTRNDDAG